MKIFLIRHGETTGDIENRYGGTYDDHMTERGKNSARDLAKKLTNKSIEKIFASPYHRARETAEIIGEELELTPEIVDDIRERNSYGILSGLTEAEAAEKFPREIVEVKDYHNTVQGAEDYNDFVTRIKSALNNLMKTNFETIAMVTHGQFIRTIFRELLKLDEIKIEDCGFAVLENDGKNWWLIESDGIAKKGTS